MAGIETVTMGYHLGVDAGGTSTRAVVLSSAGRCFGVGRSGSGNPIASGPAVAAASLRAAATRALSAAGVPGDAIVSTAIAMAGGSSVSQDGAVGAIMAQALLSVGIAAPLTVEADLLALFLSGASKPDGYALVAGTGAAAVCVRRGEVVTTGDGLGWLLGDDGSGFWIGREVARAAAADLDGRASSTTLTTAVLMALEVAPDTKVGPVSAAGLSGMSTAAALSEVPAASRVSEEAAGPAHRDGRLQELVTRVYAFAPVQLARLAPLAFEAAAHGDPVAVSIVARAGQALARTLDAVATSGAPGPVGTVVVGGGVLTSQPALRDAVRASWSKGGTDDPFVVVTDGLAGAGVLALRAAGVASDADRFTSITSSLARLRSG